MNISIKIKKVFIAIAWLLVAAACVVLLLSGVHSKDAKRCRGVAISISGVSNNFFIDKNDVYAIVKKFGGDSSEKKQLAFINLKNIETALEKDVWIKNAELYFDNNNFLKVFVEEREPIARIFTISGNTFYIDSSCMMLPLSEKFSARLPVFTGFTSDAAVLSVADSNLLYDVKNISTKILADTFLMAMIDQVDITAQRTFEMIPKIGKQNIIFGNGTDAVSKFEKLKLFYKEIITKSGWNRYNTIDLQYKNQVVAKIRGKDDILADSLQTLQLMKLIVANAAKKSADSLQAFAQELQTNGADSSLIQTSMQRDETEGQAILPAEKVPVPVQVIQSAPPASSGNGLAPAALKPAPAKPVVSLPLPVKPLATKTAATKVAVKKSVPAAAGKTIMQVVKKPARANAGVKTNSRIIPPQQKPKVVMPKKTNDY